MLLLTLGKLVLKSPLAKKAIAAGVAYTGVKAVLGETVTNTLIEYATKPTPLPLRRGVAKVLDFLNPTKGFSFTQWNDLAEKTELSLGRKKPKRGIEVDFKTLFGG